MFLYPFFNHLVHSVVLLLHGLDGIVRSSLRGALHLCADIVSGKVSLCMFLIVGSCFGNRDYMNKIRVILCVYGKTDESLSSQNFSRSCPWL